MFGALLKLCNNKYCIFVVMDRQNIGEAVSVDRPADIDADLQVRIMT